uniref:Uncharacterized protein n=1 Tax=Avena sativa TaxID=4498 RepID=A0ACD5V367_AVESA
MASSSATTATPQRVCSFEPSPWKDFFVQYEPEPLQIAEECMRVKADKLKVDIRMLFQTLGSAVEEKMTLCDTLRHLGIDHLFEDEINMAINEIHKSDFKSGSLHEVALHFRLLREHGHWVSPDVFNKFKGIDGSFTNDIINEPRGLLSLYNAAYLSVHAEPELDESISLAKYHLELMRGNLKYPLSEQVKRSLEIPYPRTLKRIDVKSYIAEYNQEEAWNPSVLELAKLDFNLLQYLHQRELKEFCRWGNDLYEEIDLNYSRNRIVECYFWSHTVHYEQQYGQARIVLAKIFVIATLLDDTFDMHATLEEGRQLNEAIQRWDESAILLLPNYLKKYYVRLMKTFTEIEDELKLDYKYRVAYCREAFQTLCKHYQQESEWFHSSYIPSFEDHQKNALMSSGIPLLSVSSLVGMGDKATKEAFKWAIGCTDAVKACSIVGRLMNDMTAFKHGKNKMDVACSVDSYIKQYHVTSEVAMTMLDHVVQDAWKTSNQARFDHRALLPQVNQVISITKSMAFMYHHKRDLYTFSRMIQEKIRQQFIQPISL